MKAIGGFFGFESEPGTGGEWHDTSVRYDCGRSAFRTLLGIIRPAKVFVPYYTCDALLQPLQILGIDYEFYGLDRQLEIAGEMNLRSGELLVYINYFGIKDGYCDRLVERYGNQVVLDNTMAFFYRNERPYWGFNSCRKFFGVPDGAYLSSPERIPDVCITASVNEFISTDFLFFRNEGLIQKGFELFKRNEEAFGNSVHAMSRFTHSVMSGFNYGNARAFRRANFDFLHRILKGSNGLEFEGVFDGALYYPYFSPDSPEHALFWDRDIFVPRLWTECLKRGEGFGWEKELSTHLIPIPIDHRYTPSDLERILTLIL
jgi:hypothetical protein